jgi:hypothetical protein
VAGLGCGDSLGAITVFACFFLLYLPDLHSVTNIHSEWFPRNSRLLLFFGFVTFTLAYTMTNVALHDKGEQLHPFAARGEGDQLFANPETAVYLERRQEDQFALQKSSDRRGRCGVISDGIGMCAPSPFILQERTWKRPPVTDAKCH